MCNPIGGDEFSGQPAFSTLAAEAAKAGFAALRFDYEGCGNSAGSWSDPGRWEAWIESVRAASSFMRAAGVERLVLVGLHLGALLALLAASDADADAVVLWEPVLSGRAFLRQQQLLMSAVTGLSAQQEDGSFEVPTFAFRPDLVASMRKASGTKIPASDTVRILAVTQAGEGLPSLSDSGWKVEALKAFDRPSGIGEYPSPYAEPRQDVSNIVAWLSEHIPEGEWPVHYAGRSSCRLAGGDAGVTMVERPEWMGNLPLFGITCEPEGHVRSTTVVILSTGIWPNSGTGHMWSQFSREWAALGIRTLRVDLSGIGESGARPEQPRRKAYYPYALEDCKDIARHLGDPNAENLVFLGTSSGGLHCLEAGLGLHPRAVVMANPTPAAIVELVDVQPDAISESQSSSTPLPKVLRRLAIRHKRLALKAWWLLSQVIITWAPQHSLAQLLRKGVTVRMLVGEDDDQDVGPNAVWNLILWRYKRNGRYSRQMVPDVDHGFFTRAQREVLRSTLTTWLRDVTEER